MRFFDPHLKLCFIILLLFGTEERALSQNLSDTLSLPEFEIRSSFVTENHGFKRVRIDSTILMPMINADLSAVLSRHSTIFIKNYGSGSLASPSFRGTSAHHTQVQWNGIGLNSPMLGQTDLSLIQVSQFDELEILFGSSGISRSSGAFGGIIDLVTRPDWQQGFRGIVSQSAGSFGSWHSVLNVSGGTNSFQSATKLNINTSRNDFPFDENGRKVRQQNGSFTFFNGVQELYWKPGGKNLISAKVWYNYNFRNLPPIRFNPPVKETLLDNGLRSLLEYKRIEKKMHLMVRSAVIVQNMSYNLKDSLVNDYRYISSVNKLRLTYRGLRNLVFNPGVDFTYDHVDSDVFMGFKTRLVTSASLETTYDPVKFLTANLVLRMEMTDGKTNPLIPALGVEVRPWKRINLGFSVNLARNFRNPTLNDLYWPNAGNPDLRPETSNTGEAGIVWNHTGKPGKFVIEMSVSGYYSRIVDMIAWAPGNQSTSIWKPENINEITSRGIEAGINSGFTLAGFQIQTITNYHYCKSTYSKANSPNDAKLGKQQIYIPEHTLNAELSANRWGFYLKYQFFFISDRYTSNDEMTLMPGYSLSNIIFGRRIKFGQIILSLQFDLNNVFNLDYESIARRPMPGINKMITIRLAFPGCDKK